MGEGDKRGALLETKKDALISHCVVKGKGRHDKLAHGVEKTPMPAPLCLHSERRKEAGEGGKIRG